MGWCGKELSRRVRFEGKPEDSRKRVSKRDDEVRRIFEFSNMEDEIWRSSANRDDTRTDCLRRPQLGSPFYLTTVKTEVLVGKIGWQDSPLHNALKVLLDVQLCCHVSV